MKLVDIFKQSDYHFSKLAGVIWDSGEMKINLTHLKMISAFYSKLKTELELRGEYPSNVHFKEELELIEYTISRIRGYFSGLSDMSLPKSDAKIFVHSLRCRHKELMQALQEMDENYNG